MHWRKTFGEPIVRAVLSFSLAIAAAAALASDYVQLEAKLAAAKDQSARLTILLSAADNGEFDTDLSSLVYSADAASGDEQKRLSERASDEVSIRAALQRASQISVTANARSMAKSIKNNPIYRDSGVEQGSNWISRAMEKLINALRFNKGSPPTPILVPAAAGLNWFVTAIWFLLGALLLLFLFFAIRHFAWKRGLKKVSRTLLEEDEPERTLDEWLRQAEVFVAEGDFRKGVRCLYLACLIKFDEFGVARFDRGETNWEHLARIERSPKLPSDLDFRAPTEAFDRIWYGFKVRGLVDVDEFRNLYNQVVKALKEKAA